MAAIDKKRQEKYGLRNGRELETKEWKREKEREQKTNKLEIKDNAIPTPSRERPQDRNGLLYS